MNTNEEIASAIENRTSGTHQDCLRYVMPLLGHEVMNHGRLGIACRKAGESHWQSCPDLQSANDADLWLANVPGAFSSISQFGSGEWEAAYAGPGRRAGGRSRRLGAAMWAAFVRSVR